MYKYLNFFNKKGEYFNFEYLEDSDKWVGRIDFGTTSEDLIEDYQLYIMEEVYNTSQLHNEFTYPIKGSSLTTSQFKGDFDKMLPVPELFIYQIDENNVSSPLTRLYTANFDFDPLAYTTNATTGIKQIANTNQTALQINVGFCPSTETGYSTILYLVDDSDHVFAEILLYGEGEEEDERLRDYLIAIGCDLLPQDEMIFDQSDVNEIKTDWKLLNLKRKEMLLEYSNIFPYLGSYKALINVIKFFGYQNLRMKEYWLNIDSDSPYYNKIKQINISDVFSENAKFNDLSLIPSKVYKKTNKFGLYYDITVESGKYDDDGIPIAEEVYQFTPHEILIKIYALKKKLQNVFLPVNAKIVDIIGEAVYFGKYDINYWNDQCRIDSVSLGIKPSFNVLPSKEEYIQDLRPLYYFGSPIGPDLQVGGYTDILSWRIGLATTNINVAGPILDTLQTFRLVISIPTGTTITLDTLIKRDIDTGQTLYKNYEVANKIIANWKSKTYLNDNFTIYQEGGTSGIIRIVQKTPIGNGTIFADWFSESSYGATIQYSIPGPTGGTSPSINVSSGPSGTFGTAGAPMSYYQDCFIGYFDKANIPVKNLNDDEDIPVGAPFVLENTSFNVTWDDANVTFDQIDTKDELTGVPFYKSFTISKEVGWTSIYPHPDLPTGATYVSIPTGATISGFPSSTFPSQYNYAWNNLGYYGYYEMQWIVEKVADETPAFRFDSGVKPIFDINSIPIILPYVGSYKVSLYMWDGYNTKSYIISENVIDVKLKNSDFIGWYQHRELDYNIDTKRYPASSQSIPNPYNLPSTNLTWDEYPSTWDLPLHPNEEILMAEMSYNSLDSIEFYKSIKNPSTNPLIDRFPYNFNLMTDLPGWNDLYHLWWDSTGTKITQFEINTITGPTSYIFATKGNTIVDLDSSISVYYESGPTGFTGATGITGSTGNIGDIIVSNSNRRTYRWNGTEWSYIKDIVDSYQLIGLSGTDHNKFVQATKQLNQIMPLDSSNHSVLSDFIYYYDEAYDSSYNLKPYIRAVSKDFDKGKRHKIRLQNATGDTTSYETVYFGYLGDIPTSFEIYEVPSTGPTGTISLNGMTTPYSIGSTNLINLYKELNGATAQSYNKIGDYTYNVVYGTTGSTAGSVAYAVKIIGVAKAFTSPESITVNYTGGIIGTTVGRSLIKNPDWNEIRILKYAHELPLCTVVNFTYDNSKLCGKKNPIWKLTKEGDADFADIYYNNKFFSYMFTERGSYTLNLQLEDTNGNKKEVTKKEIIKII
jgi:hypothetical protein